MADEPTPEIPVPAPETPVPAPAAPTVAAPTVAAPAAPEYTAPTAAPKRKIWPFVLGGAILVFLLLVVGLVIAVLTIFGVLGGGDPKQTVVDYDKSFKNADCSLFQSTTTTAFQDQFFGEDLDCAQWVENAEALTIDGKYQYTVKVISSDVEGTTAQVVTDEVDSTSGDPVDYSLRYYLVQTNGHWLIEGIDNETAE